MAYWVGGSGNWADPTKWSSSSGGTAADTLGSELITTAADRDFSSDTGFWTKGIGWTITGGTVNYDGLTDTVALTASFTIVKGSAYKIEFDITSGTARIAIVSRFGAALFIDSSYYNYSVGHYVLYGVAVNVEALGIYAKNTGGGTAFSLDNISVKAVTCFPSSTVDAIFDANSFSADGNTVTINAANCACANLDFFAIDQTVTFANAAYNFEIYGNLVLPATKLTWTFTGTGFTYLKGTGSQTITTNGMTMTSTNHMNRLYFDGVGGTWTNQDAANFGATDFWLYNGIWNTNNQTITSTGNFNTAAGTKTLTLGSSTFNIGKWVNTVTSGFTFYYNTSTVNITETSTITGATTFYNLTLTGVAAVTAQISLAANITVSNVFTPTGNNATNYRLLIASNTIGTARTITAASVSETYCDYRDITMAGACLTDGTLVLPADGLRGDCGGNTAITFTTGIPLYYKHESGACTWKDATKWFTDLTPRTTAGRVPLPQDSAILDANSFTGTSTLTIDVPRRGSVDMSGVNQAVTTTLANATEHYGHLILGSNITPSGNYNRWLMGRSSYNLNLYSKSIFRLYTNHHGGNYTILSDFTVGQIIQYSGNINLGNNIITFTESSGSAYSYVSGTISCGTSTIKLNPVSGSSIVFFDGGGKTYYNVWFSGTHTGYFDITGSNTFNELKIDPGRKVRVTAGTTQTVSKLNAVGTQANPITLTSVTSATHTLALASGQPNPQCDWMNISYSIAPTAEASKFYAGNGSVDSGNNTGWVFRNISKGMLNFF